MVSRDLTKEEWESLDITSKSRGLKNSFVAVRE